jgi:hypothetical protein
VTAEPDHDTLEDQVEHPHHHEQSDQEDDTDDPSKHLEHVRLLSALTATTTQQAQILSRPQARFPLAPPLSAPKRAPLALI